MPRHGNVGVVCASCGRVNREGGSFESVFVRVFRTRGDRVERYETFDLTDSEPALARFAELSARR